MKNVLNTLPKRWVTGAVGAVAIALLVSYLIGANWHSAMVSAVLGGITAVSTMGILAKRDAGLVARMSSDAPISWAVWMNGVKVGMVTDAQLAAMQRQAFPDLRLLGAQALNLGQVALNVAGKAVVTVPLAMFWLLVAAWAFAPESITAFAETWRSGNSDALQAGLGTLFHYASVCTVVTFALMSAVGHRFGFRNHYAAAVERMIRQQCDTPTEGYIYLAKMEMPAEAAPQA